MVVDLRLGRHKMSENEARQLDKELRDAVSAGPPYFTTAEDAMSYSRGYPWRMDDSD